jgi:hypothetical protein
LDKVLLLFLLLVLNEARAFMRFEVADLRELVFGFDDFDPPAFPRLAFVLAFPVLDFSLDELESLVLLDE